MEKVGSNGVPDRLARASAQQTSGCGMWILLLSLSILFLASLVGYLFIHFFREPETGSGFPPLPGGLWLSTVVLLASSATVHWALSAARRDNKQLVKTAMTVTLLLGLAFLVLQALNWAELHRILASWIAANGVASSQALRFYTVSFYFMTVLHAAHVLGGIIPMAGATAASYRGFYTRTSHNGLRLLSMYWHFLDIVWLVLFAVLSLSLGSLHAAPQ